MITLALRSCLSPAHRAQPCLQPPVVALDPVVGVPVGAVPGRRQQVFQHYRVSRRLIGGGLSRGDLRRTDRPFEEALGRLRVAPRETWTSMTCPDWSMAR